MTSDPFPKSRQLARGERRYGRKVASPKQWQAIRAAKCEGACRICEYASWSPAQPDARPERWPLESHHLIPRDRHADFLCALAIVGGTLERIATEIITVAVSTNTADRFTGHR